MRPVLFHWPHLPKALPLLNITTLNQTCSELQEDQIHRNHHASLSYLTYIQNDQASQARWQLYNPRNQETEARGSKFQVQSKTHSETHSQKPKPNNQKPQATCSFLHCSMNLLILTLLLKLLLQMEMLLKVHLETTTRMRFLHSPSHVSQICLSPL
jgi:hypothetical protein